MGAAVGFLSLLVVAGCGDGGDESTTVTKAEFTKQANSICAKGRSQIRAAGAEMNEKYYEQEGGDTASQPANIDLERKLAEAMIENSMLPAMEEQLDELESLSAPAGGEATISKMLNTYAKAIEELESKGVAAMVAFESLFAFEKEAKAYGLDCSVSFAATPGPS